MYAMENPKRFHIHSPLLESISLSKLSGTRVYLKMENVQPSGSFKIRGIGHLCQKLAGAGSDTRGVVCSSGGNAGLATAYAARKLGIPATIIVPLSSPELVVQKLRDHGATVKVLGKVWDDANTEALRLAEREGLTFVPPFDHPLIWEGHASLVKELKASLSEKPGAIVLSVGGGGLFCGLVQGLKEVGWEDIPILCMETVGANCFNAAIKAGQPVTLPDITSKATCLGAKTVCRQAFEYRKEVNLISELVTDQQTLEAMELFLDEERVLVEMACGAALAAVYSGLVQRLQKLGRLPNPLSSLVVIVCGGSSIDRAQLSQLRSVLFC
ncbi:serine dehydratase-like [Denticeps clupeoides]|uniref:L-serine deaminase n=1 Tax=Denticeps clupeoides TaxID=299321 RepID=A0AAY4B954_9TELE|nr:serine dehydratase-like [Denticeps clupeoides]XP_028828787.1 serine dehydratase-like [Denticeps clupeoides]XP_028828797.1 serine dehydratase-like [Denticeps clupeoides]